MDPITAGINAFGQLCALLSTPQGQLVLEDVRNFNKGFSNKFSDLFDKFHNDVKKLDLQSTAAPAPKAE